MNAGFRATVAVQGRFHAFYLARALQDHGHLDRLITTYPKFEVAKYGIAPERTRALVLNEVLARAWRRAPDMLRSRIDPEALLKVYFDRRVAGNLRSSSDLFVGWSGSSLGALGRARSLGMVRLLERGSSHMATQLDLLAEEYALNGLTFRPHHAAITERELQEYEETDYICIPSQFVRRTFLERGVPAEKLLLNGYGVDLAHFGPGKKRDDVFRVIYCGAMSVRKGIGYLLEVFSRLRLANSELWLIGARQAETEPLLARYRADNIRHLEPFPEFQLQQHYHQGSVFCMPSIEEGMAMVQVQALACGLPLICTTNTGGEDLITEGREGFVVPIRDVEALQDRLLHLYENPEDRAEMASAARRRVEAGLRWSDYGDRAIANYQRVLAAAR